MLGYGWGGYLRVMSKTMCGLRFLANEVEELAAVIWLRAPSQMGTWRESPD